MYIHRSIEDTLRESSKKFPVIGLVGPRQSGKTTILQNLFKNHDYVNLEDIEVGDFALKDPKGFLKQYKAPIIIDEAQRAPQLFSQIQVIVDQNKKAGSYILSGSQNFLLMDNISQSLAGRISLHTLLPFSLFELKDDDTSAISYNHYLFNGFYPNRYENRNISPHDFYSSYIQTYVERDLRQLINVLDLSSFRRFLKLLAGRVGQELNYSSLAQDAGITHNTAKSWISVLETSYIVFLLQPYYRNFNKRLVKSPKLYFHDVGLASWLLNIDEVEQLTTHFAIGGLFENLVISEYIKHSYNTGKRVTPYFLRDQQNREIDLIIDAKQPIAVELKAGKTVSSDYFKHLRYWQELSGDNSRSFVVYGGDSTQKRSDITILPWSRMSQIWKE